MSRSTVAKSRAEKGGKSTSAPTPAVTHEIVPGKFNDQDWNAMVDHDDGDDFVWDVVDDIVNIAMDVIHKNYLEKQLVPFTVVQAKDALLQIIEWQFLSRDAGESKIVEDTGWAEDEEPAPALTDCWAQGSVPRRVIPATPEPVMEETEEELRQEEAEAHAEQEEEEGQKQGSEAGEEQGAAAACEEVETSEPAEEECRAEEEEEEEEAQPSASSAESKDSRGRQKKKFRPHRGPLRSAGLGKMTQSLEHTEMEMMWAERSPSPHRSPDPALMKMPSSCHSIVKSDDELQNGRPPGHRDVQYDGAGNVVGVTRINPARLPSHRVRTGFQVVDPSVEAAQARLEAMRTGRYLKQKPTPPKDRTPRTAISQALSLSKHESGRLKETVNPLPPPLLDSMEVSPGVVVKEGDRVKKGPRQHPKKADPMSGTGHRNLRPVMLKGPIMQVTVQDLLDGQGPVIRPLSQTPPIPPIVPHSPQSQAIVQ